MSHSVCLLLIWVAAYTKAHNITKRSQPEGGFCADNDDCASWCCVFNSNLFGVCKDQAGIGEICGYLSSGQAPVVEEQYAICDDCTTKCCCGDDCCPTKYCTKMHQIESSMCSYCSSSCCCNNQCCPVNYCEKALVTLTNIERSDSGKRSARHCRECPSGCCCGDRCCLTAFCQNQQAGYQCTECQTGCCCGSICCAMTYCQKSQGSSAQMLANYYGFNDPFMLLLMQLYGLDFYQKYLPYFEKNQRNQQSNLNTLQGISGLGLLNSQRPPPSYGRSASNQQNAGPWNTNRKPAAAPGTGASYYGGTIATNTEGHVCLRCTTGCCCDFGCCSSGYCSSAPKSKGPQRNRNQFNNRPSK